MVKHPYNTRWTVPAGTRILIVGTAPPPRFDEPKGLRGNDFDFFYGSEDNYMWQYLDDIALEIDGARLFSRTEVILNGKKKIDYTDTSEECCRIADRFLRKRLLWMKDVLEDYTRKSGKERLATDNALVVSDLSACTDFVSVLEETSTIDTLAFTSRDAAVWSLKRLGDQLRTDTFEKLMLGLKHKSQQGEIWQGDILGRGFRLLVLPSPSGRAASPKTDVLIYRGLLFA